MSSFVRITYAFIFIFGIFGGASVIASEDGIDAAFKKLIQRDFSQKEQAIQQILKSGDVRSNIYLKALLDGKLYYRKVDKRIVNVDKKESGYQIFDVRNGEDLGVISKRKVKKITINNKLRGKIKSAMASLALNDPDAELRLAAVKQMLGTNDVNLLASLKVLLEKETDDEVKEAINEAMAFSELSSSDPKKQLEALVVLGSSLNSEVRAEIVSLSKSSSDPKIKKAALKAVKSIESKISFYTNLETLFFGLSLGSILALAAIGLAITFGVMGVINMAHGELIMIGAYTTYVVQLLMPNYIGASILVSIPAAFIVSAIVGIAIERGVIRFLYGRPLETLLATFGISLILQQTVRSIFSPLNRSVETPSWMSGSLEFNSLLSITYNRLYIFVFCLIVFWLLYLVMKKTSLGLNVRAVSQNRAMARAMGVRTEWVDAMTFGLGSGIAGVAGVALSQITNVGPNLGQAYIVDSFMVVVFGGVGNLWGTLISGLSLGVVSKFLEPETGAVLAKILVLVFIILFIQKRPKGLFPQKGRAAEG